MARKDQGLSELKDVIRPGTSRGLDFVDLEELRKRTGTAPQEALKFALAEALCNGLDKDNAGKISVEVHEDGDFYELVTSDDGSKKLTEEELKIIFNFENKASSKRGLLRVSRGYLGNALKCIIGYSHALAESEGLEPPGIVVQSGEYEYRVNLIVDRIRELVDVDIVPLKREDDGFTRFIVKFPKFDISDVNHPSRPSVLKDIIFATSMVNPSRKIAYNTFGEKSSLGSDTSSKPIRSETSVLWYSAKQFLSLYKDYVKAKPETMLKEFIALFRGFTSKRVIKEVLQELTATVNHDSQSGENVQFLPSIPISNLSENAVIALFRIMKARAKPIDKRSIKSVLGCVGEDSFEKLRGENGWRRLRYTLIASQRLECPEYYCRQRMSYGNCENLDHVEFPYLVELAVFDRNQDGEGLKVYQCVNYMASMEDLFSRIFKIKYRLGRVGITEETPVTVLVHLICPVLKWLNYGKSGLDE